MAHLVVTSGPHKGLRLDLTGETTRIGRRPGNDLVLDTPSVSGTHCEIVRENGIFHLKDLGSTNGTRLNRIPIQMGRLSRNDIISAGDVSFMIDGDDVPLSGDNEEGAPVVPRTTVMIRPQITGSAKVLPPPDFRRRIDARLLWILIISLIGLAIVVAAFVFLRSEMAGI